MQAVPLNNRTASHYQSLLQAPQQILPTNLAILENPCLDHLVDKPLLNHWAGQYDPNVMTPYGRDISKTDIKENQLGVAVGRYRNYPYAPTKALAHKVVEVLRGIWNTQIDISGI